MRVYLGKSDDCSGLKGRLRLIEMLESENRLRNAVTRVPVPANLADRLRTKIHAEQLQAKVNVRLRVAVASAAVPPFLAARIRSRIRSEEAGRHWPLES